MASYTGFGLPEDLLEHDAPDLVLAIQSRENFETEWARAAANPTPPISRIRTINGAKCRTREGFVAELNRVYQDSLDASRGEWFTPNWNSIDDYLGYALDDKDGFEVLTILNGEQLFAADPDELYRFVRGIFQFRDWRNQPNRRPTAAGTSLRWVVHISPESYSVLSRFLMAGLDRECPAIRLSLRDLLSADMEDHDAQKMMAVRADEKVVYDSAARRLDARKFGLPEPDGPAELPSELGLPADLLDEDAPVLVLAVQSQEDFEAEWATAAANPTPPMSRVRTIDGAKCRNLDEYAAELTRAYQDSLFDATSEDQIGAAWNWIDEILPAIFYDKDGFEVLAIVNGDHLFADEPTELYDFVDRMRYIGLESRKHFGGATPPWPCLRTVMQISPESFDSVLRFLLAGMDEQCLSISLSLTALVEGRTSDDVRRILLPRLGWYDLHQYSATQRHPDISAAVQTLSNLVDEGTDDMRVLAAKSLHYLSTKDANAKILSALHETESWKLKSEFMKVIATWWSAPEVIAAIDEYLNSPDPRLRAAAAEALGQCPAAWQPDRLQHAILTEPDEDVRGKMEAALERWNSHTRPRPNPS